MLGLLRLKVPYSELFSALAPIERFWLAVIDFRLIKRLLLITICHGSVPIRKLGTELQLEKRLRGSRKAWMNLSLFSLLDFPIGFLHQTEPLQIGVPLLSLHRLKR